MSVVYSITWFAIAEQMRSPHERRAFCGSRRSNIPSRPPRISPGGAPSARPAAHAGYRIPDVADVRSGAADMIAFGPELVSIVLAARRAAVT